MGRIRYLKPGFFKNDDLASLDPLVRILFAGLWTEADREGRLEDRPKRIKAEVLPYDDLDMDAALDQLAAHNFIRRYESGGVRVIQISNWAKHQKPHSREAPSDLPPPPTPGAPSPNGVTHLETARKRQRREKAVIEHDLGRASASPDSGVGDASAPHGSGASTTSRARVTGTENGERRTLMGNENRNSDGAAAPGRSDFQADGVRSPPIDPGVREQLAYRLTPISKEFGDDQPGSSLTRVIGLMLLAGLEHHDMDNALKEALHYTKLRMQNFKVDKPMPYYLGVVEQKAQERAAMRLAANA